MFTEDKMALPRTLPEKQGVVSSAILEFVQAVESQIHELHSFMLLRHGHVIAEGWWSPYKPEYPHMMFSLSKSFTATAVGLAISEGRFALDDSVLSFFPDDKPAVMNDHWAAIRVRHLLSMSTGHAVDTMPKMFEREDGNWTKAFFDVPVVHEPGTHFLYNTGATYMLSAIVQKTTGMKLLDYLQPRLFEPLRIENATWQESPQGINTGGFGLNIKTEDIARFGQLYLQKGRWQGRQLVPEAWGTEATAFHISNGSDPNSDWAQGYGYQFWRCKHGAYRGDGAFGQYCIVMPEQDAVLAITAGVADMQQPLNLVWELLLPAMNSEPLPDDSESQVALTEKLSSLALPLVQGQAVSSVSSQVSGRTYTFDTNDLEFETVTFDFTDTSNVTIKSARVVETIISSFGEWSFGQTKLFNSPWAFDAAPIVAGGAWTADDTFTIVVRFYETPFFQTLVFCFNGDTLNIETQVNVSFEGTKRMTFTAHRD